MAKDTVEILGGQLDGAVLQNAASEATLKELVAAISGNKGGSGGGSSMLGRTPAGMIAGGIVGAVGGAVKGAVNQIGNVTGAAGAFAGMMLKGEGRISSYTKVLNNQVISQLPLVGRYLGAVGGAISGTIEEFERWNKTLQNLTGTGATFNNSILQMMHASARTYMSLDQFEAFVSKNNKTLVALGTTVSEGAVAFSNYSYEVLKAAGPARKTLIQMGYTVPQINQQLADYLENNYRGTRQDRIDKKSLANSFVGYQTYVHRLTALTGKQYDQLKSEMDSVQNDTAYKLKLSKMDVESREKMNLGLTNFTAMYGPEAAKIYKAIALGLNPATEEAALFQMLFPDAVKSMRSTLADAENGLVKIDQFKATTVKDRARLLVHSARQLDEFMPLLKAGSAGVAELQKMLGVSSDVAALIARTGTDVSKMSLEEAENMIRKADQEAESRETFTEILRSFETAMGDFKTAFLDVMIAEGGPLDLFSKAMKGKDLPDKIRKFGREMGYFVVDTLPQLTKFFANFGTSEGREYYRTSLNKMMAKMGAYLLYYLPKVIGLDGDEDELKASLTSIDTVYDKKLKTLRVQSDQAVTKLISKPARSEDPMTYGPQLPGGNVYQDISGKIRNQPISGTLAQILAKAAKESGVDVTVRSGGQMSMKDWEAASGEKKITTSADGTKTYYLDGRAVRTGSIRHDAGDAADLDVYMGGSNTPLSINDPAFRKFIAAAKKHGITNMGAGDGYMETGGPGTRIHMGIRGSSTTWGAGNKHSNAHPALPEYRYGTLGTLGSLFGSMGNGASTVEAHDEESILSPAELTAEMVGAAEYSSAGVSQLNENLGMLVSLMNRRNQLAENISDKMARGSKNLVASFG